MLIFKYPSKYAAGVWNSIVVCIAGSVSLTVSAGCIYQTAYFTTKSKQRWQCSCFVTLRWLWFVDSCLCNQKWRSLIDPYVTWVCRQNHLIVESLAKSCNNAVYYCTLRYFIAPQSQLISTSFWPVIILNWESDATVLVCIYSACIVSDLVMQDCLW